jgi:8-oxo-dGTP pyrophosphatase MutT (NUDIX family)
VFFLLIKQNNGVIGFPKGHVEKDETEVETALRECFEETNVKVDLKDGFREEISYYMEEFDAHKTVVFFLGQITDNNFKRQECEISEIMILNYVESLEKITFNDTKTLLTKAHTFIKNTL